MKPENIITAHNIKILRDIERLTQAEFGKKYGTTQHAISYYEVGEVRPTIDFILKLSKGSGLSPETILNVKFKTNSQGRITNIPKPEQEILAFKKELNDCMREFKHHFERIFTKINTINDKIDAVSKDVSKTYIKR